MSFVTIDDVKLYYELKGAGQTIVLVHAGICDSRMWDDQFNFFSKSFQVLRYDLRGFGQSSFSDSAFSHSNDLKKLLDFLNIQKIHIVACSFGCMISIDFTLEYPDLVSSLTLVNGRPAGFKLEHEEPHPLQKDAIKYFEDKNFAKTAEIETLIWLVGRTRTKGDLNPLIFQKVVEMDTIALENESNTTAKDFMIFPNAVPKLPELKVPITFIVGTLDEPVIVTSCEQLTHDFNFDLQYIEGTAHLPNLEKPEIFNELVEQVIKETK